MTVTLEDRGYEWVGSINHQFGAWLAYWQDAKSGVEEHTAHGSLRSARRWMREAFGRVRYEQSSSGQFMVYAKVDDEDEGYG